MYKIILLDYSMPEMNGPEVAIELRSVIGAANMAIPYICCCTAYGDQSYRDEAMFAGMNHFLTKPIDHKDLTEILRHQAD